MNKLDLHRRDENEDDEEPDVGEHREDHGDAEDRIGLNSPSLSVRNDDNTEDDFSENVR